MAKGMEYREVISFSYMKAQAVRNGGTLKTLAAVSGVPYRTLVRVIGGEVLPDTGTVAAVCGVLQCSVSDVMEFKDLHVRDLFRAYEDRPYPEGRRCYTEAVYRRVSYEPLRHTFREAYRDKWKEKLAGMLGGVRGLDGKEGVPARVRALIMQDESIPLRYIHDICIMLRCPPHCVMEYK